MGYFLQKSVKYITNCMAKETCILLT